MNAMMMIERWPDHGAEIRVYTLTPEEIASVELATGAPESAGTTGVVGGPLSAVRCNAGSVNAGCDETEQQTLER